MQRKHSRFHQRKSAGDNSTHEQMSVNYYFQHVAIWLKSTSVLYWMLGGGFLDYAVVSGLVILHDLSFSGLLASPCGPVWYHSLTCANVLKVLHL